MNEIIITILYGVVGTFIGSFIIWVFGFYKKKIPKDLKYEEEKLEYEMYLVTEKEIFLTYINIIVSCIKYYSNLILSLLLLLILLNLISDFNFKCYIVGFFVGAISAYTIRQRNTFNMINKMIELILAYKDRDEEYQKYKNENRGS